MPTHFMQRPMINYPSSVRATETITDEGRVFALRGEIGAVLDGQIYEQEGLKALTVVFPDAPCATTVFLGDGGNVEIAPTVRA